MVQDGMVTLQEAQDFLRISRQTLWRLTKAGQLPYVRIGRTRRIPKQALVEFAAGRLIRRDK